MNLILDDGSQFGLGAFETIPVYQGRPVWLEAHERRLRHTLEYLGIDLPFDWENYLWEYVYGMDGEDWVLKILASDKNINFTSRANPYASMADRPGYVIALSSIRRNETPPLVRHKTFNYGDSILAKRQARAEGIDEPIFCNMQGQLTEGAVSNLFSSKTGGSIRRPSKPDYCQASSGLISVNVMMSSKSPCIRKISGLSTSVS